MTGTVFSIEEFSVYDGPGIRTSVFLKGCPLRCSWCHNPEGQSFSSEIVRSPNGCCGCLECEKHAVTVNGSLVFTDESIMHCPNHLLRICGEKYESTTLCEKLLKNQAILKNGGGVTFSGGEPLAQSEFLVECLDILKEKLHTAIQTSGYCEKFVFEKALSKADYFLFDLKIYDEEKHIKYTGVSNSKIHKNFSLLTESGVPFVVRMPLIPTVTDTKENISDICRFLCEKGVKYAELLPYNKMAGGKYKLAGKVYTPMFDESVPVNTRQDIFEFFGIKTKIL